MMNKRHSGLSGLFLWSEFTISSLDKPGTRSMTAYIWD